MSNNDLAANEEGMIICPYCKDNVPSLVPVDPGMKLRLIQNAQIQNAPDQVCDGCHKMLMRTLSKGQVLRAEQMAKEQNRLTLWRNRVGLIKQAKLHLANKAYSDAAIEFEKYIRVLEIVYEKKPGELTPELFRNEQRAQEMTVIASVYWDLMRIYDHHNRFADRQMKTAAKLAEFARFTPIFPHIIRKAESQARNAKNPEAFKKFIKLAKSTRPRCFIATAAFDGERTATVDTLCRFRDEYLKQSPTGRRFVATYYGISPKIASYMDMHPNAKPAARLILKWIAHSSFVRNRLNT